MHLTDLHELGGFPHTLTKTRLAEALQIKYPDCEWEQAAFMRAKFRQQQKLQRTVSGLFQVGATFCCAHRPHTANRTSK